ncbi:MAG: hypothetical protein AMXMBFR58_07150 [Phycisphaerae bacterium]
MQANLDSVGATAPAAGVPVAQLIDVRKTYYKPDGSVMVEALRGVNLSIFAGEYVAIMGASGSGKSTLMYVLGCLDRPTSGQYLLDGKDVAQMPDEELSRFRGEKIGFIFQSFNLIPQLTIEENAEVPLFYQGMPKPQRRERSIEALKMVELDHRLGHRPSELSGGQQQRAAIARALVTRPLVLMADEPTGNLDSNTGAAILRTFEHLHDSGMTIVMVTHDPAIGRRAGRVITMRDGDIASDVRQARTTT